MNTARSIFRNAAGIVALAATIVAVSFTNIVSVDQSELAA